MIDKKKYITKAVGMLVLGFVLAFAIKESKKGDSQSVIFVYHLDGISDVKGFEKMEVTVFQGKKRKNTLTLFYLEKIGKTYKHSLKLPSGAHSVFFHFSRKKGKDRRFQSTVDILGKDDIHHFYIHKTKEL